MVNGRDGHSREGVVNGWNRHSREGVINGWEGHSEESVVNGCEGHSWEGAHTGKTWSAVQVQISTMWPQFLVGWILCESKP